MTITGTELQDYIDFSGIQQCSVLGIYSEISIIDGQLYVGATVAPDFTTLRSLATNRRRFARTAQVAA